MLWNLRQFGFCGESSRGRPPGLWGPLAADGGGGARDGYGRGDGGAGRGAIRFSFFHIVYSDKEEFNFVNCT